MNFNYSLDIFTLQINKQINQYLFLHKYLSSPFLTYICCMSVYLDPWRDGKVSDQSLPAYGISPEKSISRAVKRYASPDARRGGGAFHYIGFLLYHRSFAAPKIRLFACWTSYCMLRDEHQIVLFCAGGRATALYGKYLLSVVIMQAPANVLFCA